MHVIVGNPTTNSYVASARMNVEEVESVLIRQCSGLGLIRWVECWDKELAGY